MQFSLGEVVGFNFSSWVDKSSSTTGFSLQDFHKLQQNVAAQKHLTWLMAILSETVRLVCLADFVGMTLLAHFFLLPLSI